MFVEQGFGDGVTNLYSLSINSIPVILVSGSRRYSDEYKLHSTLDNVCLDRNWYKLLPHTVSGLSKPEVIIINGGANGADYLATTWASANDCKCIIFKADWDLYGKKAGAMRNTEMLVKGKPDLVVAFPLEGSIGTYDMIRKAKKAGVETLIFT